jgi:uncharacterized protein (TIGR03790 family)
MVGACPSARLTRRLWFALSVFAAGLIAPVSGASADHGASGVVLLANREDPDSLAIARHYAAVRGVPLKNIIALPLRSAETITWPEFVASLWQPLLDELVRTGWIDAVPMISRDAVGRRVYGAHSHRISALVVCRGVPLRIDHDSNLLSDAAGTRIPPQFRTNAGAVDSELSLIAQPNYAINGFVANPLFAQESPSALARDSVVKVSRLDGPSVADAMELVDLAVAAEASGLWGRAYVDFSGRDPLGDRWLEDVRKRLLQEPFDIVIDRASEPFAEDARFDAPVLYFGWYARDITGPLAARTFRFPVGAIALHIHSYSAVSLRSATAGWVGPLVARGATAALGNVREPFLQHTHRPDLLLRVLLRGATLADAAYYALPSLSWQAVLVGDPLYRPFARSANDQSNADQPNRRDYATLARMRQALDQGNRSGALDIGTQALAHNPGLALAVAVSELHESGRRLDEAASALGSAVLPPVFPADQWGLAAVAAQMFSRFGQADRARELWVRILASPGLPLRLRQKWLPTAIGVADASGDRLQASRWRVELAPAVSTTPP